MADQFTDRLSEYLDGEDLAPAERAQIEAHLAGCAECRAAPEELREVAAFASALPDSPPSANLWSGVSARIQPRSAPRVTRFQPVKQVARRVSFTLPQLIAAGLALMVLSGGSVWLVRQGGSQTDFEPVAAQV